MIYFKKLIFVKTKNTCLVFVDMCKEIRRVSFFWLSEILVGSGRVSDGLRAVMIIGNILSGSAFP